MSKLRFLFLALAVAASHFLLGQCPPGETHVRLEIDPDENFEEVYFGVATSVFDFPIVDGAPTSAAPDEFEFCVPDTTCLAFFMYDKGGDGFPGGYFRVYINDSLYYENPTGKFSGLDLTYFGCPPGSICSNALDVALGAQQTPDGAETWYRFMPQDTGTYKISTCDLGNACASKIWVYDFCKNLFVADNQAGALFYAAEGCADGATATLYLAGGKEYFIRLKYRFDNCQVLGPLKFSLEYLGPVVGCSDPAACNYNPLATVTDTCIYDGAPCLRLPDLQTDEALIRSTFQVSNMPNSDLCMIEEGCIRGFGNRYLIEFSTRISNVGDEDYYIGETPLLPTDTSRQFVWDPCHNHWHYRGYAEYVLYDQNGRQIPIGSKTGFCVLDLECNNGGFGKYTCENMGISAGCGDVYDRGLPCQWIDITGLEAGLYTFVVRVNWEKKLDANGRAEKDYDNNWAQVCFNLTYDGNVPDAELVNDCPKYADCTGVLFGSAQPDCDGVCNGPALRGDWDKNAQRDADDVEAYLDATLAHDATATECRDLFADGEIDLYDAALLQECALHGSDPTYWGSRFSCNFPGGLYNPTDQTYLRAGTLDTAAKTWTIRMLNPNQKQLGYQFKVAGLEIDTVFNLVAGYDAVPRFNRATGEILALTANEASAIKKNAQPTDLLRIRYKKLTAPQVCITEIRAIVSTKYHKTKSTIGPPACTSTGLVGTDDLADRSPLGVFVQPNPFDQQLEVFFQNPENEAVEVLLTDLAGHALRHLTGIRGETFSIERNYLATGIYFLTLRSAHGSATVKVAAQ